MPSPYAAIAQVRARQLPTRIALAVFLGVSAWVLAPSIWPVVWFAVMSVAQAADWLMFRAVARSEVATVSRRRLMAMMASSAINTAIYSSIAAYMWSEGGEAGRVFAMVQVAGGLLHVALHMSGSRALLLSTSLPHAAYLFGLPIITALDDPRHIGAPMAVVTIAACLYVAHLVAAARQTTATTTALRSAQERAEQASNAKSEFLATISHEIRTPMNAVISAAHLLRRTELTGEQTEHVDMLLNAGDVLVALLNDVLDLSKIEAGRMTLEPEDVDVDARIEALVKLWRPRAEEKDLQLGREIVGSLPERLRLDPLRFQQILFNVLSNAVKFTAAGSVTLRTGRDADRFWVEVVDTGCGLTPLQLEQVFDTFIQAHGPASRQGSGLGLPISRKLAQLMGGDLTASSRPGQGSCFRLELPLVEADGQAAAADSLLLMTDAAEPADERPLSILVVEDHPVNQRIVALFLEPLGWTLTQAWNGAEAVEAAAREPFDVILMDMQMPVMNGLEATQAIRDGGGPNAATPVVALTAAALDQSRQAWLDAGAAAFLTKPIQPEALIDALLSATGEVAADQALAA